MAEKASERASLTIAGLVEAFMEGHAAKLKSKSVITYQGALDKLTAERGSQKAETLTRSQVAALHLSLSKSPVRGEPHVERRVEDVRTGRRRRPRA